MGIIMSKVQIKDKIVELFNHGHNRREIADILKCDYSYIKKIISAYTVKTGADPRTPTSKAVEPHEIAKAKECIKNGMSARTACLAGHFPNRTHSSVSYLYRLASGAHERSKDISKNEPSSVGGAFDLERALERTERAYIDSVANTRKAFPMPKVSILQEKDPEQVKTERLAKLEKLQPQHDRLHNPIGRRSALFHKIMSGEDVNLDNL